MRDGNHLRGMTLLHLVHCRAAFRGRTISRVREKWDFSVWRTESSGWSYHVYKYLVGVNDKERA